MKNGSKLPSSAQTVLSKNSVLKGDLDATGDVLAEGKIEGSITSHDNVYIGKAAVINGDITAKNVYIFGVVQGNVNSDGAVRLSSSAKLFGDVRAKTFNTDDGSVFKGALETSVQDKITKDSQEMDTKHAYNDNKSSVIESL